MLEVLRVDSIALRTFEAAFTYVHGARGIVVISFANERHCEPMESGQNYQCHRQHSQSSGDTCVCSVRKLPALDGSVSFRQLDNLCDNPTTIDPSPKDLVTSQDL